MTTKNRAVGSQAFAGRNRSEKIPRSRSRQKQMRRDLEIRMAADADQVQAFRQRTELARRMSDHQRADLEAEQAALVAAADAELARVEAWVDDAVDRTTVARGLAPLLGLTAGLEAQLLPAGDPRSSAYREALLLARLEPGVPVVVRPGQRPRYSWSGFASRAIAAASDCGCDDEPGGGGDQ